MGTSTETSRAALEAALSRQGVELGDPQKELLLAHLELLFAKNGQLNLTRIDDFDSAIVSHIEDSLSVLPEFDSGEGPFCDIGTGGGFPGIPLAIATGRPAVLLESVKKKARAVKGFVEELGLGSRVACVGSRSEEYALDEGAGAFSVVVARAVSSLPVVEELAAPLLAPGGRFLAMRGTETAEQERAGASAADKLGLTLVKKREFTIGEQGFRRSIYVFERTGEPHVKVPRRPGMAQKRPLG